ncbi:MAG TPA: amino acid adenylation domain-containing protein, partial [Herpetosiphonaceae bacterium]
LATLHHIIADGWSSDVLVRELITLYTAYVAGAAPTLARLPIQYADYATWQRRWFQGPIRDQQLAYWKQQLGGCSTTLDLPTDRPRPAQQTFNGAALTVDLPRSLVERLRVLGDGESATLFMTLLATWQTLLYRYTYQTDILVGTPIAGRRQTETEGLIGFFVNTLVLRADLSGNPSFRELLRRVREMAVGAYAHQDVPFEALVEELRVERDPGHAPLVQTMFALQNTPKSSFELPGITLAPLQIDETASIFDLTLSLSEHEHGIHGVLGYNSDLFDRETIVRLSEHWRQLLHSVVADPERRVDALLLASDAERRQQLAWNATDAPFPEVCVQDLFAAQAARTPDAIAVTGPGATLTYAQLDHQATHLAHLLQAQGVRPEISVALLMDREPLDIVAILAVFKAGGAVVLIDPGTPSQRQAAIFAETGARLVLTQRAHMQRLPADAPPTLRLDTWTPPATPPEPLPSSATPDHLAYVIYTSGSTGTPKGALLPHRGLTSLVLALIPRYGLDARSRVLQWSALSFDAAIADIWPALLAGATIVQSDQDSLLTGPTLLQLLEQAAISHVFLVPTALAALPQAELPALRTLVVGGESSPLSLIRRWETERRRVINIYGPTETTVCVTVTDKPIHAGRVRLGPPLPNTQVFVLDAAMQPVPAGVIGEIYIGGVGVARGYVGRPDLTAAQFVPDPLSTIAGARLYRTGDLGRWWSDGQLEFIGRRDEQVKLRGFRIELGEIESALRLHPAIREAAVVLQAAAGSDPQLVAYIVEEQRNKAGALWAKEQENQEPRTKNQETNLSPSPVATEAEASRGSGQGEGQRRVPSGRGEGLDSTSLRAFLREHLPDYMIPAAFVPLDALPRTTSGKLDRKALPVPDPALAIAPVAAVLPRDTVELDLLRIWEELLTTRPIGVTDSFFEIGGHSLLAVRLIAQIQQRFGRTLTITTLFQSPTIEQQAALLRKAGAEQAWSPIIALRQGSQRPFFCVHPIGGHGLCYLGLARQLDRPMYALQARGLEDGLAPHATIEEMAAAYLAALRSIQPRGPYLLGGWSFGGIVAFEIAQQLQRQGETVALLALLDSYLPLLDEPVLDHTSEMIGLASDLSRVFGKELVIAYADLRDLTPEQQLSYVLDQSRQQGVVPPTVGLAHIRRYLDVFRANLRAAQRYVPQPYSGPIMLFQSEASIAELGDSATEWQRLAAGGIDVQRVPGDHYSIIISEPEVVAERLRALLAAQAG